MDHNRRKQIDYLAGRLLAGEPVTPEALEYFGIRVRFLGNNVDIEVPGGVRCRAKRPSVD